MNFSRLACRTLVLASLGATACVGGTGGNGDGGASDAAAPTRVLRLLSPQLPDGGGALVLPSGAVVPLAMRVTTDTGAPVRAATVRLALLGEVYDGSLDRQRVSTDGTGTLTAQLAGPTHYSSFLLRAQTDGAADLLVNLQVGSDLRGRLAVDLSYAGRRSPQRLEVALFAAGGCEASQPVDQYLPRPSLQTNSGVVTISGLVAGDSFDVRARALGVGDAVLAEGCARTPVIVPAPGDPDAGASQRLPVPLTDLSLLYQGRYQARLALDLSRTTAAWATAWAERARAAIAPAPDEASYLFDALTAAVEARGGSAARARFEAALAGPTGAQARAMLGTGTPAQSALASMAAQVALVVAAPQVLLSWSVAPGSSDAEVSGAVARATLDPLTPEVSSDDRVVELQGVGPLQVAAGAGDRAAVRVVGLALSAEQLLSASVQLVANRVGVTEPTELASLAVPCAGIADALASAAAPCDASCLAAACASAVGAIGAAWTAAVVATARDRSSVNLVVQGVAVPAAGTRIVQTLSATSVQGTFVDPGGEAVAGQAQVGRVP